MTSYNENLAAPRQLSLMVYELLDKLGLSEEIRKLHREYAYTGEISHYLVLGDPSRTYIFGSAIEGTQTPGMSSDIDIAFVVPALEIFTNCSISNGGKPGVIVVQDETTPPRHVKLQLIYDYEPLQGTRGPGGVITDEINTSLSNYGYHLLPDDKGRIVITVPLGYMLQIPNVTKHGVAFKKDNKGESPDFDYVPALNSKELPNCLTDCLMRKRNSDFFTGSVVEACKSYECLFVRKEHCQSKDSHLLWRISPSHQERFLMFNFNSVQHKCYVLLKLIKKDIINPALGSEVLTSYHCKTAMLHLIDMTPSQFWRPDNLLFCLNTALHCLLLWSMDSNCPNFFIPDEKMFQWRISRHLLKKLSNVLFRLMSLDFVSLLRSIKTDSLYYRIQLYMIGCQHLTTLCDYTPVLKFQLQYGILAYIMQMRYRLVLKCYSNSTKDLVVNLDSQRSILIHTDRLDIHSPVDDTQRTISLLVPYIEIYLMSNTVALSVQRGDTRETTWGYLTSVKWHEISHSSDPFTSRLKQASLMSALGCHRHSYNLLSTIENKESLNGCSCFKLIKLSNSEKETRLFVRLSTDEILHQFWTPCVLFLPTEKEVVPSALCYEMSIPEAPADIDSWHDHWAIVDGKFLLHFLLYLNRKNLGLSFESDIQEMERFLKNERRLFHRDTDLNLLGWVYKEKGKLNRAYKCFKKSLHFRPQQKAAIWHILCLISSLRL